MKPVLIQSLIRHNQRRKALKEHDVDHAHGGHKDRSGFIVMLILVICVILAMGFS